MLLSQLLTNLAMMNQLTGGDVKAKELVNWFEFRKTGCPLLYLGLTILLNWMICIAVDWAINYPMSRARMLTSVRRFVVSLVTSAARVLCGICSSCLCCLPDPKKRDSTTLRRDPPGASRNSGLRTMRTDIDAVFFRRRNASRSLGLNVQVSELFAFYIADTFGCPGAALHQMKLNLACTCIPHTRRWDGHSSRPLLQCPYYDLVIGLLSSFIRNARRYKPKDVSVL